MAAPTSAGSGSERRFALTQNGQSSSAIVNLKETQIQGAAPTSRIRSLRMVKNKSVL